MQNLKTKTLIGVTFFAVATLFIYNGCKKETPKAAETCYDGILNQDETDVDCGGSLCDPCPSVLCDGNGDNTYVPLVMNNQWTYQLGGSATRVVTADSMVTFGANTYFRFKSYEAGTGTSYAYFRKDGSNNIYEYKVSEAAEFLAVPAAPTAGQIAATYTGTTIATLRVVTTNAQVNTASCSYTGCVQMGEYNSSGTLSGGSYYYKKGIGLVRTSYTGFIDLKALTLN